MEEVNIVKESDFKSKVEDLIRDNLSTYKQWKRITSDFRNEKGTTKAYNGRQLLELLQNADDAKTDEVEIVLDRDNNTLSISNNGTPFTAEEGVTSLMIANTSSKNKEFIGNKGLGFRSILNWVSVVKIKTQTDVVEFSREIAKTKFESLDTEIQSLLIKDNEDRLEKEEVPFAVLAIPKVYSNNEVQSYKTTIELKYIDDKEEDIVTQLNLLESEILLFLNYTNKILIRDSAGEVSNIYSKTEDLEHNSISINDNTWNIKDSGEKLYETVDDKERFYNYKIAWQDDLSDVDSRFFTFFPTQVSTKLPFLIHATFDLDPARNHLNKSDENSDLLNEIATAIGELAVNRIRKEKSDWLAYKFLSPKGSSDNPLLSDFFENLKSNRESLEIYPCVDGSYRVFDNVSYFGNDFSTFIIENGFQEFFKNLLSPIPEGIIIDRLVNYNGNRISKTTLTTDEFYDSINKISIKLGDNISTRAKFIYLLSNYNFYKYHGIYYPLLINNNDGDIEVIDSETTVFTSATGEEIESPSFVKIDTINKNLYLELIKLFQEDFDDSEPKARELQRAIKNIVNIQPYDITNITKQIISGTNSLLKKLDKSESVEIIKEMVYVLFYNKGINPNQESPKENITLINKQGNLVVNGKLFLGKEYLGNTFMEDVFRGVYDEEYYLIGDDFWELGEINNNTIKDFFVWLGVKQYSNLKYIYKSFDRNNSDDYAEYVFDSVRRPERNSHKYYEATVISNFDTIVSAYRNGYTTKEMVVLWIAKDNRIYNLLDDDSNEKFTVTYNKNEDSYPIKHSYLKYQFRKERIFDDLIVDSNMLGFNISDPLFEKYDIGVDFIKSILIKLGAKKSFLEADPEYVYDILRSISNDKKYAGGKDTQKIYKKVYEYFSKNTETKLKDYNPEFEGLQYFARKGGKGKVFELKPYNEIYYSDNQLLPDNIWEDYWIINLPKRIGEEKVKKYFGVNLVKDHISDLELINVEVSSFNKEFSNYIDKLKPYFLTYRLTSEIENKEQEAALIRGLNIVLVEDVEYSFGSTETTFLDKNSFIQKDHIFYVKNDAASIEKIRREPEFCDAIAEILSVRFKVTDLKNKFRSVFKDSIDETKHLIKIDELEDYYNDSYSLLGLTEEVRYLWTSIYKSEGLVFSDEIREVNELRKAVKNDLDINLPNDFTSFDLHEITDKRLIEFIQYLLSKFKLELKNILLINSKGLLSYHYQYLEDEKRSAQKQFDYILWNELNSDKTSQSKLISEQEKFNNILSEKRTVESLSGYIFEFIDDYKSFFKNIVKDVFRYELKEENKLDILPEEEYTSLLKKYSIEENDLENSEKSLLYFHGNEDELEEYFKQFSEAERTKDDSVDETKVGTLHFDSTTTKVTGSPVSKGKGGNSTVGDGHHKKNKRAGKKAEFLVLNSLKNNDSVAKVNHVSGYAKNSNKSDNKHYDIEYLLKGETEWRYLEVKSFNGKYFHLSRAEKEEAIKQGSRYEIALVQGEDIHIQRDMFIESVDFDNNELFEATPADYIISLKVEQKK